MIVYQLVEKELPGKPKFLEKTIPSAIFSNTNPIRLDTGLNLGRRIRELAAK
jgi:hypothetical protein